MHRKRLLSLLDRYGERHREEANEVERIRHLVTSRPHCFERHCLPGHVTASCWIVSGEDGRCLLTHHRKLGRWLQLGGHADGDPDPTSAALREAREESGLLHFEIVVPPDGCPIIDVDVHRIPAIGSEPAHEHHDVRFLLRARAGQAISISEESLDLRWFTWEEVLAQDVDESVLRLARKSRVLIEARELVGPRGVSSASRVP